MMVKTPNSLIHRITGLPEFNIYLFAFLLNFVWEFLQMPLFSESLADQTHWEVVKIYAFASVADGFIMLIAFWAASAVARSRYWFANVARTPLLVFLATGLAITSAIELAAIAHGVWAYSALMPTLFGIGLSPLMQWIIPPLITLWLVRRQLGL